jgi:hypothetical protein
MIVWMIATPASLPKNAYVWGPNRDRNAAIAEISRGQILVAKNEKAEVLYCAQWDGERFLAWAQ